MTTTFRRLLPVLTLVTLVLAPGLSVEAADLSTGRVPIKKLSNQDMTAMPGGAAEIDRGLERQQTYHERSHAMHDLLGARKVSARSRAWLTDRNLGPARLKAPFLKAGLDEQITLRIILARISFETNREPELSSMSPSGDFFLDPADPEPLPIDPSPHDRAYFEAHMQALGEYYRFQSGGRLTVESMVLPSGDNDSYKVSDVADYGPGAGGGWTLEGLEALVRDMILAADAGAPADGVHLSDYDDDNELTYVIFAHAGSDWQSDVNQDSPNDIPTFFVTLGEPQIIDGGAISECSVIPETTTQDGYKGSISAALYHEFGHALGLPDVYDASTGLPAVGVWDLMDSGTNLAANIGYINDDGEEVGEVVSGILPPSLSAWDKWFLGWVDTELITGGEGEEILLPAVGVPREEYARHNLVAGNAFDEAQPQVLIGGASPREFFLVENRWVPRSAVDTPYDSGELDYGLYFKKDPGTGVVLYLGGDFRGEEAINTGYYDYFMPEGGLLVWHVDSDRVAAGLEDNEINRHGDGVKLIEADGLQDIGVLDAYVLGWYGSETDPFAPWNDEGYLELFPSGAGVPTSRANDRAWTGLRLWDIADDGSAHGAVMRLRATVEPLQAGWPVDLPPVDASTPRRLDVTSLTPVTDADGHAYLVATDDPAAGDAATLFAWTANGDEIMPLPDDLPTAAVTQLDGRLVGAPAAVPADAGGETLVLATRNGTVQALAPGATMTALWTETVADSLLAGPLPVRATTGDWMIAVIDGEGLGHLLDADGQTVGDPVAMLGIGSSGVAAPLRAVELADGPAVLVCAEDGLRLQPVTDAGFGAGATTWSGRLDAVSRLALLPGDAGHRLLIFGDDGLQGAWTIDGAGDLGLGDWEDPGAALVAEPAVADLDGDGALDVIAATAGRIFAWSAGGVDLTGYPNDLANLFPLPDSTRVSGPLVVADLAGGPANELALATDNGHLFVLDGRGSVIDGTPFRFGSKRAHGLALMPRESGRASLVLADAGGYVEGPRDAVVTSGRLALYADRPLPGGEPVTAGWFGLGGGASRQGTVGVAAPVAGETPADDGQGRLVLYPNPLQGRELTVRFWSATDRAARLAVLNLQGEIVLEAIIATEAGRINESTVDLDVASGLYVTRLTFEKAVGDVTSEVRTLAVAR